MQKKHKGKLPPWLKRPLPAGGGFGRTASTLDQLQLQTICVQANCPNRGECWSRGTTTVLILGKICTRNCKFCSVAAGKPGPPDPTEADRLAEMTARMGINYLVITSVNRDDLPDGGAAHFRDCVNTVRRRCPGTRFEILTPDFMASEERALATLAEALPFVFAHNVETVPSLYSVARQGHDYRGSLALLKKAKEVLGPIQTKSSVMLGLGESDDEVIQTLRDLRSVQCDRLTIGQYLKPSPQSLDVVEYIQPDKFHWWQEKAQDLGFSWVFAAPFARSSYFAEQENMSHRQAV